jgi:hypothetical protein
MSLERVAAAAPRVAELPSCQNTMHAGAATLLITVTDEPAAVVSVLPIWKTNCAFGSRLALRVGARVRCADDENL